MQPHSKSEYRCRLEWGLRGVDNASARGDIVVIVDVLSFSSVVATAVDRGAAIIPCRSREEVLAAAACDSRIIAAGRRDPVRPLLPSLSPASYFNIERGACVAVESPNGGACSLRAGDGALCGCLLNASAVAAAVSKRLTDGNACVTVVPCGERVSNESDQIRFALEDGLGAGAILAELPYSQSPDARRYGDAFVAQRDHVAELIWDCVSGRELRIREFPQDVKHASMINICTSVPVLSRGRFEGKQ
jgi:2-phosphosulfolactate phosphatase